MGTRRPYRADTAAGELRRIERVHRVLRPGDVVEESRDPDAPLHGCFTWDDAKAGEKLRLQFLLPVHLQHIHTSAWKEKPFLFRQLR